MRQSTFFYLLSLATSAVGLLDKPPISPAFPPLEIPLANNLNPTQSSHDTWGVGWIPQDCYDIAQSEGFRPMDFENFNIYYTDCGSSWVFCRHINAAIDTISMIDLFGRLPVRSRQDVRHVIAMPSSSAHAYSYNDNIALFGSAATILSVWIHETSHSLDGHAYESYIGAGNHFSDSSIWIDNYNQDSAVSDPYAQTNQAENLAQETVIAIYDKVVPGGIGPIQPNWNAIFHQYATIQGYIGDTIIPGGTCAWRLVNSAPVQNGWPGRKRSDMPDVSLANDTVVLKELPVPYKSPVYYPNVDAL